MTRPRVLVSGYYGFANAGDEAILAGMVEGFGDVAPEVELTVLSGDPEATAAEHGVKAVPRGLGSVRTHLRESDLLVSGGGGLLQDATSWRSPLYYLEVVRLARRAGVPVACIGHGLGPLRRWWVRWLARRGLSQADVLCVRDRLSERAIADLGLGGKAEVTADLAFLLPRPDEEETARAWRAAGLPEGARGGMGAALRRPPGRDRPELARGLGAGLTEACRQVGLAPTLVPMQHPRDVEWAEAVASEMDIDADVVRSRLGAREVLALMGGFGLVVAMRLHALIFAAIVGAPPVAVSYDPKVDGLMGELGMEPATAVEGFDAGALARVAGETWDARDEVGRQVAEHVVRLRTAARRNVELAVSLLKARGTR